jgi:hypothetical protein
MRFDDDGRPCLTVEPEVFAEPDEVEHASAPITAPEARSPMVALRCMSDLLTWAGKSKVRLVAVGIVLGHDTRPVREASLAAKLDRTGVYRAIREARRIIAKSTARPA